MALIAHLYINNEPIGYIAARRTAPGKEGGLPGRNEVHTYEVDLEVNGQRQHGAVTHRYGDGAAALIAKAAALGGPRG